MDHIWEQRHGRTSLIERLLRLRLLEIESYYTAVQAKLRILS